MENKTQGNNGELDQLKQRIADLEKRMAQLEEAAPAIERTGRFTFQQSTGEAPQVEKESPGSDAMESRIGEYGMAWLGNVVLLVGILFLSQFLQNNNQPFISLAFGYGCVAMVYLLGYLTRKSLPYMSRLFSYNGHLLLYIQAMRICLFQESQIIENAFLGHAVVVVVLLSLIYLAYRNNSQVLAIIVWLMMAITAIADGSTHFMLPFMVGISGTAILFAFRKAWWTGLTISIFLSYFIYLMWIMGNPIISKTFEFINIHQMGHVYLFVIALAYTLLALAPASSDLSHNQINTVIVLNGLGFTFLLTLTVLSFFTESYFRLFGMVATFSMAYSIWIQLRGTWKPIAAMYAIYSFVALSITIAGIFSFPLAFLLLSIQSLLVVIVALWFRSRFMVIMNTILFVGLLIAYFITGDILHGTNFSFALVALSTARILNWKKQRLEIRTELIRNIFLFSGAFMVLFSLHEAVSPNFVTLSWTLSAMVFFVLSVVIRNMKYRWLAIITMVITVFYLFLVDLSNISLGYRIVALMFIAIISLGISMFYSRRQKGKKEESE